MAGTSSKDAARAAVKKAFTKLRDNVTGKTPGRASAILKEFIGSMQDLRNKDKKEGKTEKILGKYYATGGIKDTDRSPISKAVKEFLDRPGAVFTDRRFVNELTEKPHTDIGAPQDVVTKELGKCKRLKSADVLAAVYHVASSTIEKQPVLGLLILGEMFTELGKANGFIKGKSAGVQEDENGEQGAHDAKKDNENRHLGTLATKELRSLAATIGQTIKSLFGNAAWLKKEENTVDSYTESPRKGNSGDKEEPKTPRAKAIEMQQADNARQTYLKNNEGKERTALNPDLAPRDGKNGKYMNRDSATDDQLKAFLKNSGSVIKFIDLKSCAKDDAKFKDALNKQYRIGDESVSLRKILNKLAEVVYKENTLIKVVEALPATPEALDSLLTLVEAKLQRSGNKNARRVTLNKALRGWVTIINVVNACTKTIEVTYIKDKDYADMLTEAVGKLKDTEISVIAETGETLETKKVSDATADEIREADLIDLTTDHKKRLKSLKIEYQANKEYKQLYTAICTFIKTPNEENLNKAEIKMVTETGKKEITEKKWNKSKEFDEFVANGGAPISKIAEKKQDQKTLPPVNGTARDARLVLSADDNAYADFDAKNEWFEEPTQEKCGNAVKDITVDDYLGTNINLLKALKSGEAADYVLGIKSDDFVESWVKLAEDKLGENALDENNNYVKNDTDVKTLDLENELKINAKIDAAGNGYDLKEVNDFVEFVKRNSNADFCGVDGIKDTAWGNLMNGTYSLLVKADPETQSLTISGDKFTLENIPKEKGEGAVPKEEQ